MRYAELALWLIPAGLLLAWLFGLRGLTRRGVLAALALMAVAGAILAWVGTHDGFTGRYVPAHLDRGQVVPGHRG